MAQLINPPEMRSRFFWSLLRFSLIAVLIGGILGGRVASRGAQARSLPQASELRRVLVLYSAHPGDPWSDHAAAGVKIALEDSILPLEVYVEYMDIGRFTPTPAYLERLYILYRDKYRDVPLDAIITAGDAAFQFARQYREWSDAYPVIFCGVRDFAPEMLNGFPNFTGLVEQVDVESTMDMALDLHSAVDTVLVIADAAAVGRVQTARRQEVLAKYSSRAQIVWPENPTLAELHSELQALPPDRSLVMLLSLEQDREGAYLTPQQALAWLREVSAAPIYAVQDGYLGYGIVGGMLTDGEEQGHQAGALALRVIENASPSATTVMYLNPTTYRFDFRELEALHISTVELPVYSEWINREPSLLEIHFPAIAVFVVALMVVGGMGGALYFSSRRQGQLTRELRKTGRELQTTRSTLETRVAERTQAAESRAAQLQVALTIIRDAELAQDMEQLLYLLVRLTAERFSLVCAALFLMDERRESVILRASFAPADAPQSPAGALEGRDAGLRLLLDDETLVGYVASRGEVTVVRESEKSVFAFKPLTLPPAPLEVGLPLMLQGEIVGVLNLRAATEAAFTGAIEEALRILAEQMALAIRNVRALTQGNEALRRLRQLYGEQLVHAWQTGVQGRVYRYDGADVTPGTVEETAGRAAQVTVPITLDNHAIGEILLERQTGDGEWSPSDLALARAVGVQAGLALENARLLGVSRIQAEQQRIVGEIATQMRTTLDMDAVLQTALQEIGMRLGIPDIEVRMGGEHTLLQDEEGWLL